MYNRPSKDAGDLEGKLADFFSSSVFSCSYEEKEREGRLRGVRVKYDSYVIGIVRRVLPILDQLQLKTCLTKFKGSMNFLVILIGKFLSSRCRSLQITELMEIRILMFI